jgi:hypothetical protein
MARPASPDACRAERLLPARRDDGCTSDPRGNLSYGRWWGGECSAISAFARQSDERWGLGEAGEAAANLATGARLGLDKMMQEGADSREVGPEPVQLVPLRWSKIWRVACGDAHSLALTQDGQVYAWGLGAGGRLGLGHFKTVGAPCKVDALAGVHVTLVVAGYYHSMCLAESGEAFAWGSGDAGQLGSGVAASSCVPTPVKAPTVGSCWRLLAAGEYHSMVTPAASCEFSEEYRFRKPGTGILRGRLPSANAKVL